MHDPRSQAPVRSAQPPSASWRLGTILLAIVVLQVLVIVAFQLLRPELVPVFV